MSVMSSMDRTDNPPSPAPTYLRDYSPPDYIVRTLDLHFLLDADETVVTAQLHCIARDPGAQLPLQLAGQNLVLQTVKINHDILAPERYQQTPTHLILPDIPADCIVTTVVKIHPRTNTALEGLYYSGGLLATQCEPEGFRRITYFPDRPDVMTLFRTTLEADKTCYPVLLSNGNPGPVELLPNNRHRITWEDPFKKPCYLFALVAGDLAVREDHFITQSGRTVQLKIYTTAANLDRCDHAMDSLKRAMRWDEVAYGREYDLDLFMIVAIDDFNMGAMENKGLNIFNSSCILAKPETATDYDFSRIFSIVGHEYFHNWSGNRVTCRDWFQLSLKEGLTVFRDQEFYADEISRAAKRIEDANKLRMYQFPEDAGPMAHSVRPESYLEINNFYTLTIYEKGAEVIRMYQTLLGTAGFRRGMDLYFDRHDGQAVTTDDFLQAMADASGVDLSQFSRWYSQAGTPVVSVQSHYDSTAQTLTLTLQQRCPPTPNQPDKQPFHIPIALGLLDRQGQALPLQLAGEAAPGAMTRILELKQAQQTFTFTGLTTEPIPSVLRGFSAPVILEYPRSRETLNFLSTYDTDPFNRWEALQKLMLEVLLADVRKIQQGLPLAVDTTLVTALTHLLQDTRLDALLKSEALSLPSASYIGEQLSEIDVDAVQQARWSLQVALAQALQPLLHSTYQRNHTHEPYVFNATAVGQRRLKNICLSYLVVSQQPDMIALAQQQLQHASHMTDEWAALSALNALPQADHSARQDALERFYARWHPDRLVINKWFALQASTPLPQTIERVQALQKLPTFSPNNPDSIRALWMSFAKMNPVCFHAQDGAGYRLIAEQIRRLDQVNPIMASRLASSFSHWRRYNATRQALMKTELESLQNKALSRDLREVIDKSLA